VSKIGFQNGIEAAKKRMRALDPGGFNATETGAWDKFFRTIKHLVDEHDAEQTDPEEPPDPQPTMVAPRTYNTAPGGEPSARFCTTGLPRNSSGQLYDIYATYDDDGHDLGGRTALQVPGLKPANEMDGRGPCDPYGNFPPWPEGSYAK
jgi:hypothetical protein